MNQIKESDLAWVAGILEGEGSFTIEKSTNPVPSIRICCGQKDPEILYWIQDILGAGSVIKQKYRDFYVWRINKRNDVYTLGQLVRPWMSSKRIKEIDAQERVYLAAPNRRNWKKLEIS